MAPQPKPLHVQGIFPSGNVQVTQSNTTNPRSESTLAINPINQDNLVGCSKKFTNPHKYHAFLGPVYSLDGGSTWSESSLPLQPSWQSMTDPSVAFDSLGHAWLIAEPLVITVDSDDKEHMVGQGMYLYKSTDGGQNWSQPIPLHPGDSADDKQWIACDVNPSSPYYGNIYCIWGALSPLRFARSTDHGQTWHGVGNDPPGSTILGQWTYAPEISIGDDGTVHVAWHIPQNLSKQPSHAIRYTRSNDGGMSFETAQDVITGIQDLETTLPQTLGFPHFPNANFRLRTIISACALEGNRYVIAWPDVREGAARIYYRVATNSGATWTGPAAGQPLLPGYTGAAMHHFMPQIIATKNGVLGCAFYEFGLKNGKYLIDLMATASFDDGASFGNAVTITGQPWDPAVDAPWSHGESALTFIGDYFGMDAGPDSFGVLWTDTRTGVQELFFDHLATEKLDMPDILKGIVAEVLFGVIQGGDGVVMINGHFHRVPPRVDKNILSAIAALVSARDIHHQSGIAVQRALYQSISAIAEDAANQLGQKGGKAIGATERARHLES